MQTTQWLLLSISLLVASHIDASDKASQHRLSRFMDDYRVIEENEIKNNRTRVTTSKHMLYTFAELANQASIIDKSGADDYFIESDWYSIDPTTGERMTIAKNEKFTRTRIEWYPGTNPAPWYKKCGFGLVGAALGYCTGIAIAGLVNIENENAMKVVVAATTLATAGGSSWLASKAFATPRPAIIKDASIIRFAEIYKTPSSKE